MENIFTLKGALQHGYEGKIEEWVHAFLSSDGHNPFLSYIMRQEKRYFLGPAVYRLDAFRRNCGPEKDMKYKVRKLSFEFMVESMTASIKSGWDIPPLIVNYENGEFDLSDGNHRYEALIRFGITHYYIIFWTTTMEDYKKLAELVSLPES